MLFSLRMREEATASNTLPSLIEAIISALRDDGETLDDAVHEPVTAAVILRIRR